VAPLGLSTCSTTTRDGVGITAIALPPFFTCYALKALLRKAKDLKRKNLIRVSLTEKGQQAYYQSTKLETIHGIMSSLSEEECQRLSPCLEILRDKALKQLGIEQKPPFP